MFTGLVEGLGTIEQLIPELFGLRLVVRPAASMIRAEDPVVMGESVAINGCCLTVVDFAGGMWSFQAGTETLSKTNLGRLAVGDRVNLERALPANGRLGGHFVQGHVDGIGTVSRIATEGEWVHMTFAAPADLARLMVPKGSIAIDGVSLTLVEVGPDTFSIALIPHTLEVTTLGRRQVGDTVNLETDMLGKYIAKLVSPWQPAR